jgi:hypothetical protein
MEAEISSADVSSESATGAVHGAGKALRDEIAAARKPVGAGPPMPN